MINQPKNVVELYLHNGDNLCVSYRAVGVPESSAVHNTDPVLIGSLLQDYLAQHSAVPKDIAQAIVAKLNYRMLAGDYMLPSEEAKYEAAQRNVAEISRKSGLELRLKESGPEEIRRAAPEEKPRQTFMGKLVGGISGLF